MHWKIDLFFQDFGVVLGWASPSRALRADPTNRRRLMFQPTVAWIAVRPRPSEAEKRCGRVVAAPPGNAFQPGPRGDARFKNTNETHTATSSDVRLCLAS